MAIYYVDATTGDDDDSGLTEALAWKTVAKVNASMASFANGDSVLFKRGETWQESLIITKTGLTSYLTFGAYGTGAKPKIWQASGGSVAIICSTANVSYIWLDNLEVYTVSGAGTNTAIWIYGNNATNWKFTNLEVSQSAQNGIYLQRIDTYLIEDTIVHDCDQCNIVIYGSATYKITNGTIRRVTSYNAGMEDGITIHEDGSLNLPGPNHLIEDSEFYGAVTEAGIDLNAGINVTVRNCYVHDNYQLGIVMGLYSDGVTIEKNYLRDQALPLYFSAGAKNIVMRNNIIYNPLTTSALTVFGETNLAFEFYNNTIVVTNDNGRWVTLNTVLGASYLRIKNNIFCNLATTPITSSVRYFTAADTPTNTNSDWDYNWFYVLNGHTHWYVTNDVTAYHYDSAPNWKTTWSQDANSSTNATTDPLLAGGDWAEEEDFKLQPTSPCINAGVGVGLTSDYWGTPVPQGAAPDIGASEYPSGAHNAIFFGSDF